MEKRKRTPTPKTARRKKRYSTDVLVDYIILILQGFNKTKITEITGIRNLTYQRWMKQHPEFLRAVEKATNTYEQQRSSSVKDLKEFIYGRLPPDLQEIWNDIQNAHIGTSTDKQNTLDTVEKMLKEKPTQAQQALWLHAYFSFNFSQYEACRVTSITIDEVRGWKKQPEFLGLVKEIDNIRDDFFEASFLQLAREGNPYIVGMAAKSRLAKRGYNPSTDVNINGNITHTHAVDLKKLEPYLKPATIDDLLEANRQYLLKNAEEQEVIET